MKNRYQYPTEAAKQKHRYTSTNLDTNTAGIPETQRGKLIGCGLAVKRKVTKRAQQEVLIHDCSFPGVRKCPIRNKIPGQTKTKRQTSGNIQSQCRKSKKKGKKNDQILKDSDKVKS